MKNKLTEVLSLSQDKIKDQRHFERYIKFIGSRKNRSLENYSEYTEKHHILPKSLGGSNEENNLILLTTREHYIAHMILWRVYGEPMAFAIWRMIHSDHTKGKGYYNLILSGRQYELLKNTMYGEKYIFMYKGNSILKVKIENIESFLKKGYKRGNNNIHGRNRVWINNGKDCKMVEKECLNNFLISGWKKGRVLSKQWHCKHKKGRSCWVYNKESKENKFILREELHIYLKEGWMKGKIDKRGPTHKGRIVINNDISFKMVTKEKLKSF